MEAQPMPTLPEVPAEVVHDLFSKLTHEINLLALLLAGPVDVDTIHPRINKELERLGEEWKDWIMDKTTRCSVFEAFVWYEVAQYFGKLHRDILGGKIGGAFKDMCKHLQSTFLKDADMNTIESFALWRAQGVYMLNEACGNNIIEWTNLGQLAAELFAVLKTYLPAKQDVDAEAGADVNVNSGIDTDMMVGNIATLHYRLINIFSLAARLDNIMMGSKIPMVLVYGRPKRFDAAKMWPSAVGENVELTPETLVKFQIGPSIKMQVQGETEGSVATVFITKCKVCV